MMGKGGEMTHVRYAAVLARGGTGPTPEKGFRGGGGGTPCDRLTSCISHGTSAQSQAQAIPNLRQQPVANTVSRS